MTRFVTVNPINLGWLEYKLDDREMDYLWRCVDKKKQNVAKGDTYDLKDTGNWFFDNTILPAIEEYHKEYSEIESPVSCEHPYYMSRWWVNYQKQYQFNPIHDHTGIYSFVIWMKIPYDSRVQGLKHKFSDLTTAISPSDNQARLGCFQFNYINILGKTTPWTYYLNKSLEGTMLFFPSTLQHQVYPFLNCDGERISISGNILLNTSRVL